MLLSAEEAKIKSLENKVDLEEKEYSKLRDIIEFSIKNAIDRGDSGVLIHSYIISKVEGIVDELKDNGYTLSPAIDKTEDGNIDSLYISWIKD